MYPTGKKMVYLLQSLLWVQYICMYDTYVQVYTYTVRSEDILQYLYTNPPSQAISISQTTMYSKVMYICTLPREK